MSEAWMCMFYKYPPFAIRRRHHRLVMGTVGYNLNRLRGTEELLHATYDVYTGGYIWRHGSVLFCCLLILSLAMRDVLAKDSRIHRDISVGNVILVQQPGKAVRSGYLIYWETSCKIDNTGAATEMGRVVR